jgi:short-subunit dehydrogenase
MTDLIALRPVTVITGASAGIGTELARVFARNGHELMLVARRADRLETLADEIAKSGAKRPLVLALDLAKPGAVAAIAAALAQHGAEAQYLVNNAGFGLVGLSETLSRDEQLEMIDLNVRSLTELSLGFVESLRRQRGGLLNVASVAGFVPGPGMAVYYATKAYVLSFSMALSSEFGRHGVRVTALCPGPVATEFAARAGIQGKMAPNIMAVSATQVADDGYRALMAGKRRVIPGLVPKLVVFIMSLIPSSFLLGIIDARQSRRRAKQPGA